ncbi:MAG: ribose-phosphate diphosphokinase [Gammaproteobacteria bacterium]|nr:ribose-phosphate diphosphokinase [Gammaproteobacteria bacterium]
MPGMIILCFEEYEKQSHRLAEALHLPCQIIRCHRFPDAESKLTLPEKLAEHVLFCCSLNQPNEKLIELLLAAKTARGLGAKVLTLVAPYLCYMRQDKAFHAGEAISQTIIGNFLADLFDNVITVDPHLHRIQSLQQAIPVRHAVTLSATSLMAKFLNQFHEDPVLLGPDAESEQWVSTVAKPNQWQYGVCSKIRTGDKKVEITVPEIELDNRAVVLVDDVASSGQTLAVTIKKCLLKNARHVDVLVTHALFAGDAKQRLIQAGVRNIWSTDSISHESNIIPLSGLLKDAAFNLL